MLLGENNQISLGIFRYFQKPVIPVPSKKIRIKKKTSLGIMSKLHKRKFHIVTKAFHVISFNQLLDFINQY